MTIELLISKPFPILDIQDKDYSTIILWLKEIIKESKKKKFTLKDLGEMIVEYMNKKLPMKLEKYCEIIINNYKLPIKYKFLDMGYKILGYPLYKANKRGDELISLLYGLKGKINSVDWYSVVYPFILSLEKGFLELKYGNKKIFIRFEEITGEILKNFVKNGFLSCFESNETEKYILNPEVSLSNS